MVWKVIRCHSRANLVQETGDIKDLDKAGLFEEVKDRLDAPGTSISGGQQQRLCIARTIAVGRENRHVRAEIIRLETSLQSYKKRV